MEHGERRSVGESGTAATPQVSESMLMGFYILELEAFPKITADAGCWKAAVSRVLPRNAVLMTESMCLPRP